MEEITDDAGNGIGSNYKCLDCGTMDVRWTHTYRNRVLDDLEPDDERGVIVIIVLQEDDDEGA